MQYADKLLIEPVWNRNTDFLLNRHDSEFAFNRTSMESKQILRHPHPVMLFAFNRTSMESKQLSISDFEPMIISFNRTSMESKRF